MSPNNITFFARLYSGVPSEDRHQQADNLSHEEGHPTADTQELTRQG
jgi:hypothetical protein